MSARDDHAARVMAGVSEPQCWAALFDEIDRLRAEVAKWVDGSADRKQATDDYLNMRTRER